MLRSVALPGADRFELEPGIVSLWGQRSRAPVALGYAVFDVRSPRLPPAGVVEVEIAGPLDGRRYLLRRALEVPDHWQVVDVETGWLATGTADTPQWLRTNLEIPDDLTISDLFREHVCFSVPVTVSWLLEEAERRETKLREWFRTQRYPDGLRWLGGVLVQLELDAKDLQTAVKESEGQDALFEHFRQAFDAARRGSLAATERASKLRRELEEAQTARGQLGGLREELEEIRQDVRARREAAASLEAQVERWRHWQALHERAIRGMQEHQPQWRQYQDACVEIGKLAGELASAETVRTQLQNVEANALALRREEALVEEQLAYIHQVESAAAELAQRVQQQQQLEQQIVPAQERALRLELVNRTLQQAIAESKRTEVLLADVEHQLGEIEQLSPQVARIRKLQNELDEQERLIREESRHVDHLRFLDTAARAISGHLDDLRKGASATERLAVKSGVGGNGAGEGEDRGVAGHLREAIDHQIAALERQLRDWQLQSRDLAGAPMRLNQLRATAHQLAQEIDSARSVEVKLGGVPALKQHRKYLSQRFDELKKAIEARVKEQQECSDAPARLAQLRQELSRLNDPRSQQQALLRSAARKHAVELELRRVQRRRADASQRQQALEERLAALNQVRDGLRAQERRRDEAHEGYCTYLAQEAISEMTAPGLAELETAKASLEAQRHVAQEAEARETALLAAIEPLQGAPERAAALAARLEEAEAQAAEWKGRYQASADRHAAAEENRAELHRRRAELQTRQKAMHLLQMAQADVEQAAVALGSHLRRDCAESASAILQRLTGEPDLGLNWTWREAPTLVKGGASRALSELDPVLQAYCALSLRLATAAECSRFRTVFITDLGPLQRFEDVGRRLSRVSSFDQFLLPAAG